MIKRSFFGLLLFVIVLSIGSTASADLVMISNDFETYDAMAGEYTGGDFTVEDFSGTNSDTIDFGAVTPGLDSSAQAGGYDVGWDGDGGSFTTMLTISVADLEAAGLDFSVGAEPIFMSFDNNAVLSGGGSLRIRTGGSFGQINLFAPSTTGANTGLIDLDTMGTTTSPTVLAAVQAGASAIQLTASLPETETGFFTIDNITFQQGTAVPEPSSFAMIFGCGSFLLLRRRKV